MLEKLGGILKKSVDKIAGAIFVDKKLIDEVLKELKRELISADINVELVNQLSEKIRQAAVDERIKGVEKKEHIIKLLYDELQKLLGGGKKELELGKAGKQDKILFVGLYGAGKTTTIAKIAQYYKKRGKNPALLGLDVHRPAAPEQLEQLGKQINVPTFINKQEKNPIKIYEQFKPQLEKYNLVLIDSAGRDVLEKELINEIKNLHSKIAPTQTLLVMPADIGQAAKAQAQGFKQACKITGVIITRMDSSAKGGGALTACAETSSPVFFIGTGEHMQDLEQFNPKSFISRLLGMGDLETLIEKVKSVTTEKEQKKLKKSLEEGKFTLNDFYEQLSSMQSMGPLDKIAELIPGLGAKIPKDLLSEQEEKMKKWRYAIDSMTQEEINNPEILEKQTSRISRIAKGAGIATSDVRALLKQYKIIKDFVKSGKSMQDFDPTNLASMKSIQGFSKKQLMKLAKKYGKKLRL